MAQMVLSDILEHFVQEFETTTGTKIGSIHLGPASLITYRHAAQINIRRADSDSLVGLMRYKKILCDHEMFAEDKICNMEIN